VVVSCSDVLIVKAGKRYMQVGSDDNWVHALHCLEESTELFTRQLDPSTAVTKTVSAESLRHHIAVGALKMR